jgi:hypothetical protein
MGAEEQQEETDSEEIGKMKRRNGTKGKEEEGETEVA